MTDQEYATRRRGQRRENDRWYDRAIATVMRWRGLAALVWGLGGGTLTAWFGYRIFNLDKIAAQTKRIDAQGARLDHVDVELQKQSAATDTTRADIRAILKKSCLETSRADQELTEMRCPPNLYKGVRR